MIKSGKFICRKCKNNGMGTFTDWQRKEDKYIFGKKFEFLDFSKPNWSNVKYKWTSGKTQQWDGEDDKIVWENTGGSNESEWNKWQPWKCKKCNFQESNFLEFIEFQY